MNADAAPICQTFVELVRESSREARLIGREELCAALAAKGPLTMTDLSAPANPTGLKTGEPFDFAAVAARALAEEHDLAFLAGPGNETFYYCPSLLSRTYAGIIALKNSPLLLMAETVRVNSRDYPRPTPLELFEAPPFELTPEAIQACLKTMDETPEFADIACTETSEGGIYLFSSRFLEPDYAVFLAERLDVGQANDP